MQWLGPCRWLRSPRGAAVCRNRQGGPSQPRDVGSGEELSEAKDAGEFCVVAHAACGAVIHKEGVVGLDSRKAKGNESCTRLVNNRPEQSGASGTVRLRLAQGQTAQNSPLELAPARGEGIGLVLATQLVEFSELHARKHSRFPKVLDGCFGWLRHAHKHVTNVVKGREGHAAICNLH